MTIVKAEPVIDEYGGAEIRAWGNSRGWNNVDYVCFDDGNHFIRCVVMHSPRTPGNAFLVCSRDNTDPMKSYVHIRGPGEFYCKGDGPLFAGDRSVDIALALVKEFQESDYYKSSKTQASKPPPPKPWYLSTGAADLEYERG